MTPEYWTQFPDLVSTLPVEASRLQVHDGTHIHLYEAGPPDAPQLLLVSPGESPFLLISNLFRELSRDLRVTSWDHPGSPFMEHDAGAPPSTIDVMARTLAGIIDAKRIERAHVASWCVSALAPVLGVRDERYADCLHELHRAAEQPQPMRGTHGLSDVLPADAPAARQRSESS